VTDDVKTRELTSPSSFLNEIVESSQVTSLDSSTIKNTVPYLAKTDSDYIDYIGHINDVVVSTNFPKSSQINSWSSRRLFPKSSMKPWTFKPKTSTVGWREFYSSWLERKRSSSISSYSTISSTTSFGTVTLSSTTSFTKVISDSDRMSVEENFLTSFDMDPFEPTLPSPVVIALACTG
jgi:hypothetical protein